MQNKHALSKEFSVFKFMILPDIDSFLPKSEVTANSKYYTVVVCDKNMWYNTMRCCHQFSWLACFVRTYTSCPHWRFSGSLLSLQTNSATLS